MNENIRCAGITDNNPPSVRLVVSAGAMTFFTTLLQWGIELGADAQTPLGDFLLTCPGMTGEYLAETVQTIFLDGTAVDDLQIPLAGEHPVVALSAAMPGLAGAIFRRGGIHASLRTQTSAPASTPRGRNITVCLKLFNQIAKDKGEGFLTRGVVMSSASVADFFNGRKELIPMIKRVELNGRDTDMASLISDICQSPMVCLYVEPDIS